jgi:hypothetical protein
VLLEVAIRATAIGALLGGVVALDTLWATPNLSTASAKGALIAGPLALPYVIAAWGLAAALGLAGALLSRLGLAGERLVSAPVLWTIALGVLLYGTLNETARVYHELEPVKRPLRVALAIGAALLVGRGLLRRPRRHPTLLGVERGLALLGLLALVGSGLYLRTPGTTGSTPVDVASLAPRFEPEPPGILDAARADSPLRVLLVGLDGAGWERIDRGIENGSLPTFARLTEGGIRASLRTVVPTYSPAIWTTIATGVPAEAHGVEVFYLMQVPRLGIDDLRLRRAADWAEETLDAFGELRRVPVTSSLRRRKAIWNLADEAGLRAGVLGLWATWPPEPLVHGFVVSDHASLARRQEWIDRRKLSKLDEALTTHPQELEKRLAPLQRPRDSITREELGQFLPMDDGVWKKFQATHRFSKGVDLSAFRSTHLNDAFYFAAAQTLWENEHPDLMIVYAKAIDELGHFFFEAGVPEAPALGWSAPAISRFGGVVDRTYAWMDRQIAPLVDAVDRDGHTLLVVVSDHGWAREADGGYNHNDGPPGILILYGAGLCRSGCAPLRDPSVYDVAPTLLERLQLPISEELVGRPLVEAFERPHPLVRTTRYGGPLHVGGGVPSAIDAELMEKLDALGYTD